MQRLGNKKLALFDCDGVLVDSEVLAYETYAKVFAEENFKASPHELLRELSGLSLDDSIGKAEEISGKRFSSGMHAKINKAILEVFTKHLKVTPGTPELLENLAAHGIATCVVSNGLRQRVDLALKVTDLKKYFPGNHIFDVSLVKHGKPAPDLLLYAAKSLGITPEQSVMVDDSVPGIKSAQAAGMAVVGFLGGSHCSIGDYAKHVEEAHPTAIARSMRKLGDLLIL